MFNEIVGDGKGDEGEMRREGWRDKGQKKESEGRWNRGGEIRQGGRSREEGREGGRRKQLVKDPYNSY